MTGYYSEKLSGQRLAHCYRIGPPRIQQYLAAEIAMARSEVEGAYRVLELGCGYGRIIKELLSNDRLLVGIDTAIDNLRYAREYLPLDGTWSVACMDAARLGFKDGMFDTVLCLQNGISAFHIDPALLIWEARRVTRVDGKIVLTSYSPGFWSDRLEWFELQAEAGLLGKIDYQKTGDGRIVCTDGFEATTFGVGDFEQLAADSKMAADIFEVDDSSVVCRLTA